MIEIFILALLILKVIGLISISWTVVTVITLALVAVEIRLYQNEKALLIALMKGAEMCDNKFDNIEYQLNSKQDKHDLDW